MKNKHRAILVGCGGMSPAWLSALRNHFADRVEVAGLVDLNLAAAAQRADQFDLKGVPVATSLEDVLPRAGADLVFNCTIPEAHLPVSSLAMRSGCDVLTEKPLAPTVREARELLAVSAETGRRLAVIQNQRYYHGAQAVREALAGGVVGAVHTLMVDFFLGPRFGGFREAMAHPLLLDMAIHTFDQSRHFTSADAVRVSCLEFNPKSSWFGGAASAVAQFEMSNGAVFSYRGSWCARGFQTNWTGTWRIVGETGTLLWNGSDRIEVERITPGWNGTDFFEPTEKLALEAGAEDAALLQHAGVIRGFLDALESGGEMPTAANDNIKSLAMVEGAIASAQAGGPVEIPRF